jgi:hypothetical protein
VVDYEVGVAGLPGGDPVRGVDSLKKPVSFRSTVFFMIIQACKTSFAAFHSIKKSLCDSTGFFNVGVAGFEPATSCSQSSKYQFSINNQ